jgi:hypothetical protein
MSIQTAHQLLQNAQKRLNRLARDRANDGDETLQPNDFRSRLMAADLGNGFCIEYFGDVWEDDWELVQETLAHPVIASRLTSLRITGPDEGANGLRSLDFATLLEKQITFPYLQELFIRPTDVCDHNIVQIEDGQAAVLVRSCPNLIELTLPHAPEIAFFDCEFPTLRYLRTGRGHVTHGFIKGLAQACNLPALKHLDFTDALSVFNALPHTPEAHDAFGSYDDRYTSFEDYCTLLASGALSPHTQLYLRNAKLKEAEFLKLSALRSDIGLSVAMEAPHSYISHWKAPFHQPHSHLILSNG